MDGGFPAASGGGPIWDSDSSIISNNQYSSQRSDTEADTETSRVLSVGMSREAELFEEAARGDLTGSNN